MVRAWMSWSSGKDSALALATAREAGRDVTSLLVTFNAEADRVAMHAVRRALVEAQADRLGIPLLAVELPDPCPDEDYATLMAAAMAAARSAGVEEVIFGDLFLEDVRARRVAAMAGTGIQPTFPLWGRPTHALAREMVDLGMRAVVTCVDTDQLDASFVGRILDASFLADLPEGVDPCGERGEFHTFVFDAPGFTSPIEVDVGEVVERGRFVFADVTLA